MRLTPRFVLVLPLLLLTGFTARASSAILITPYDGSPESIVKTSTPLSKFRRLRPPATEDRP